MKEVLEREVKLLVGKQHKQQRVAGYDCWGNQWRSVYLSDQKLPNLSAKSERWGVYRKGGDV